MVLVDRAFLKPVYLLYSKRVKVSFTRDITLGGVQKGKNQGMWFGAPLTADRPSGKAVELLVRHIHIIIISGKAFWFKPIADL